MRRRGAAEQPLPEQLGGSLVRQCEGVGTDWVAKLQDMCAAQVSDEELAARISEFLLPLALEEAAPLSAAGGAPDDVEPT